MSEPTKVKGAIPEPIGAAAIIAAATIISARRAEESDAKKAGRALAGMPDNAAKQVAVLAKQIADEYLKS